MSELYVHVRCHACYKDRVEVDMQARVPLCSSGVCRAAIIKLGLSW